MCCVGSGRPGRQVDYLGGRVGLRVSSERRVPVCQAGNGKTPSR